MRDVGGDECKDGKSHSWKDNGDESWACVVCGTVIKVKRTRTRTLSQLYLGAMCNGDLTPPPWAAPDDDAT